MKVLVLNCGSSSVKFQLIETDLEKIKNGGEEVLAKGGVEKIGMTAAILSFQVPGKDSIKKTDSVLEHTIAIEKILDFLTDPEIGVIKSKDEIEAVGHRVVHGGEKFSTSQLIDDSVLKMITECIELAPLHNPHNLKGYQAAKENLPSVPHCAVFDTAFHQTMPDYAFIYGLPYVLYKRHGIRRYGFHGTSHRYVSYRVGQILGKTRDFLKIITIHLGNGCSMAAIDHGKSVDTSMGFTPLEGLLMGTRSGDFDPAVILYVMSKEELTHHEANTLLNKHSGLFGVSGVSNDMRELVKASESGNAQAKLAIDIFCYRIKKYIGSYAAAMGGLDVVIFTGGIGENSPLIRKLTCSNLEFLGIKIDDGANDKTIAKEGLISDVGYNTKVYAIPTNEELIIARDTVRSIAAAKG